MAGPITDNPALQALARSMRATFTYDDLWPELPAPERDDTSATPWRNANGCGASAASSPPGAPAARSAAT